ncbi:MAG: ABC transporter permease, partial [Bryobacteraceae bacterium]
LALAGGILGVVMAYGSSHALLAYLAGNSTRPLGISADLDMRILAFTAGISILTGIFFGLVPALRSTRLDLTPMLKQGLGKPTGALRTGARWITSGNSLVVAQVALTVVVLVGAGLLVHTLQNLRNVDPGFKTSNLLTFGLDPTLTGYKGARLGAFYRDLRERFSAIPGVTSVSYSQVPLLSGSLMMSGFHLHGLSTEHEVDADYLPVGPGFFETMSIPLTRGRYFTPAEFAAVEAADPDTPDTNVPVPAIVNEAFVRAYFPGVNPVGKPFGGNDGKNPDNPDERKDPGYVIVGVVQDARYNNLRRAANATIYTPNQGTGSFELRTHGDPLSAATAVQQVVH